jgi:hypothetical protein
VHASYNRFNLPFHFRCSDEESDDSGSDSGSDSERPRKKQKTSEKASAKKAKGSPVSEAANN